MDARRAGQSYRVRRRATERHELSIPDALPGGFVRIGIPLSFVEGGYDWFLCTDIAGAIGNHRATYGSQRKIQMNTLKEIAKALAPEIEMVNGRPTIKHSNLISAWMSIGMNVAETTAQSIQLNMMRMQYNIANCQNTIYVSPPARPQVYVTNGGSSSGGAHVTCTGTTIEVWEISYDGGMTWLPFPVEVPSGCTIGQI